MMTKRWTNRETKEVYAEVLRDCENLPALIQEWREMLGCEFLDSFGRQLKKDFESHYGLDGCDQARGRLTTVACSMLLERVDWRQVVERLVAHTQKV
jgi:hypothetical protein